ncbi:MAG TPA: HAMP domain-containing sensor histidine kinase [Candidatus Saccharimonadia bacterium]|nr:HAMP domain-containing sensor histidine kinase [Candidatus Saccharimonadia bacterium]
MIQLPIFSKRTARKASDKINGAHIRRVLVSVKATYKKVYCILSLGAILASLSLAAPVGASTYGGGPYGKCVYGVCAHTVTQTPSGLEVAINLVDNQSIPAGSTYTLTITPLNGSGQSFQSYTVTIDNQTVYTGTPDSDGTARWVWDTGQYPGTNVVIAVTDASGKITAKSFHIVLATAQVAPSVGPQSSSPVSDSSTSGDLPLIKALKSYIVKLPEPVVVAFPWVLFALLVVEMLVLLLQAKREAHERQVLQQFAGQERLVSDLKLTFAQLVAHYLRTPLTILKAGAEGVVSLDANLRSRLQQTTQQLGAAVEELVNRFSVANENVPPVTVSAQTDIRRATVAGYAAIWLPVALVGILAFSFVYLANSVSRLHTHTIELLTQIMVYSVSALVVYQLFRRLRLRVRDTKEAQAILDKEQETQIARDTFIHDAAEELNTHLQNLAGIVKGFDASDKMAGFVIKGYSQLQTLVTKLFVANRLKGGRSREPYMQVGSDAIVTEAVTKLQSAIDAKHISFKSNDSINVSCQNQNLLSFVIENLIDNAVAYSADGGAVTVETLASDRRFALMVADQGSGIERSKIDMVPSAFFKAEGAEIFNHEGMGFNLYLDRIIMTYLGGGLNITSSAQGTKVEVWWTIGQEGGTAGSGV